MFRGQHLFTERRTGQDQVRPVGLGNSMQVVDGRGPYRRRWMAREVLMIDMQRVMEESQVGKAAIALLDARTKAAKEEFQKLLEKVKGAKGDAQRLAQAEAVRFEKSSTAELQARRQSLRDELLERVRPLMASVAAAQGARVILERSQVIKIDPAADVTAEIMAKVDALGPLKVTQA